MGTTATTLLVDLVTLPLAVAVGVVALLALETPAVVKSGGRVTEWESAHCWGVRPCGLLIRLRVGVGVWGVGVGVWDGGEEAGGGGDREGGVPYIWAAEAFDQTEGVDRTSV